MSQAIHKRYCSPSHAFPARGAHSLDWSGHDKPPLREHDFGFKDFDVPISDVFEHSLTGRPSVAVDFSGLGGAPPHAGSRINGVLGLGAVEYYRTLEQCRQRLQTIE